MEKLTEAFLGLIKRASTKLPEDVKKAILDAAEREEPQSRSRSTLQLLIKNADTAYAESLPICQDTGSLIFYVNYGPDYRESNILEAVKSAAAKATEASYLRPNSVCPVTGKNTGNNVGNGTPYVHFHQQEEPGVSVKLMLKGGGSENCGVQYRLPDSRIDAGRDMKGVKKCVIDAVNTAQGLGCAPGTIGVGIGGDRMTSFMESKEQLFRPLHDKNEDELLGSMEEELYGKLNSLGIGPMGFGGKTTVLGVKIGTRNRVPASYFVSVTYMCWANRRASMSIKDGEVSYD